MLPADGIAGIADHLFQLFGRFFRHSRVADSGDIVVETRVIFRRGRKAGSARRNRAVRAVSAGMLIWKPWFVRGSNRVVWAIFSRKHSPRLHMILLKPPRSRLCWAALLLLVGPAILLLPARWYSVARFSLPPAIFWSMRISYSQYLRYVRAALPSVPNKAVFPGDRLRCQCLSADERNWRRRGLS